MNILTEALAAMVRGRHKDRHERLQRRVHSLEIAFDENASLRSELQDQIGDLESKLSALSFPDGSEPA